MKISLPFLAILLIIITNGCTGKHLINDKVFREKVRKDFLERKQFAHNRGKELFSFSENNLKSSETEAMEFLQAYMPLSDLADYDGEFFLDNSRFALKAWKEKSWGKSIPEEIFLHYVLPVRVNNENLDSFRIRFYDELSKRTGGLDEKSAALEVNHWCHEKVTYQPSDIRTSAPMSTILSARGRCGEESTFTVAALRTAGIPARQVYTPRWAHTDDNHAWVEVWIDGDWYYMGACEPEPVLDRGWFTEPARRAMLIHTKSFGAPFGEKNQIVTHRNYSLINNLSKYAVTRKIFVRTLDSSGKVAPGTDVEFQLYNYAEFYPLAVIRTGTDGLCSFETGLGDLMIWAHRGNDFSFRKITVNETDTLTLTLDRKPEDTGYYEYDLGVPVARTPYAGPSQELTRKNSELLDLENRKRQEYIDTWMKPAEAVKLAVSQRLDTVQVKDLISRSMGNWREISRFISSLEGEEIPRGMQLLRELSDKDLRDAKAVTLTDHLTFALSRAQSRIDTSSIFNGYVLNPRIANEMLVPWRSYLSKSVAGTIDNNAEAVARYVRDSIAVDDSDNYYNTPITPAGVGRLKIADSFSRDIYFVALCRTMNIPARLEPGTNIPQYYSNAKWIDVNFSGADTKQVPRAYLKLVTGDKNPVPEYYIHFTLARFENGKYKTLDYDFNKKITELKEELQLLPGYYMLVTGNRISDSKILSSVTFFKLQPDEHRSLNVSLRKEILKPVVLGRISPDLKVFLTDGSAKTLRELSKGGLVLSWIEPDREPTNHLMNDLSALKREMDSWGGEFVFLSAEAAKGTSNLSSGFTNLPAKTHFGFDTDSEILKQVCQGGSCSNIRFPLVLLLREDGSIVYRSEGYRIGTGEQILKNIH